MTLRKKTTWEGGDERGISLAPQRIVGSRPQRALWQMVRRVLPFVAILILSLNVSSAFAQDAEPDPANGATIYAARCANCHGPLGLGDGELAPNLPNPPSAIGSAEFLATAD